MSAQNFPAPALRGVDHTARPTWRLRETIEFYRDKLGLPLVHVISARGWGPATHPDFLHFFFDSGNGSTIAFFYYLGSEEPEGMRERAASRPLPDDHVADATHTAWLVDGPEALHAWRERLEAQGLVDRSRDPQDERRVVIRLTAAACALKEQAAGIPACILGATGCDVQDVVRLVGEIQAMRARLAGAM